MYLAIGSGLKDGSVHLFCQKQNLENLIKFFRLLHEASKDKSKPLTAVIDNLTQHHAVEFYRECKKLDIRLEFLSVASCEFNSVETAFGVLKTRLRK